MKDLTVTRKSFPASDREILGHSCERPCSLDPSERLKLPLLDTELSANLPNFATVTPVRASTIENKTDPEQRS
jgi:hypothetical protein